MLSATDSLPVPAVAETPTMLLVWALENAWVTSVESKPSMGAGENVDGLKVDGLNVDGLNVDGENVDGENVDGANSVLSLISAAAVVGATCLRNAW